MRGLRGVTQPLLEPSRSGLAPFPWPDDGLIARGGPGGPAPGATGPSLWGWPRLSQGRLPRGRVWPSQHPASPAIRCGPGPRDPGPARACMSGIPPACMEGGCWRQLPGPAEGIACPCVCPGKCLGKFPPWLLDCGADSDGPGVQACGRLPAAPDCCCCCCCFCCCWCCGVLEAAGRRTAGTNGLAPTLSARLLPVLGLGSGAAPWPWPPGTGASGLR